MLELKGGNSVEKGNEGEKIYLNGGVKMENSKEKIDILKRDKFINNIVEIVDKSENTDNMTFAINGEWGCGKTFVLEKIQEKLEKNKNFLVIPYNCWQYDYYEEPLVAIVAALIDFCESKEVIDKKIIIALKKIIGMLAVPTAVIIGSKLGVPATETIATSTLFAKTWERLKNFSKKAHKYDNYYSFNQVLSELQEQLRKLSKEHTIVFAVDELDRCLPEYAIKVLERLHHVSEDVSNIVTIIAVDKKRLEHTVNSIFGDESAADYLKKFIKFERRLDKGIQDAAKFSEKFQCFCGKFDASSWPLDKKKEEQFIEELFGGVDIRLQEEIVEEAKIFHDLCFQNEKEKPDYALMYMELLIVTIYRAYNLNFPNMPQKFEYYFQNKNRVLPGAIGESDDILKIIHAFSVHFQEDCYPFYSDNRFLENAKRILKFKEILLVNQPEQIHVQKQNSPLDWKQPQQTAIRKCTKCRASLLDNSLYCHSCGTKRKKCSCGEFLDADMNFCPKCGEMLPETKQMEQEKEERERLEEIHNSAIECGFTDLPCKLTFADKGDYIEVIPPLDYKNDDTEILIQMIEKGCSGKAMNWFDAGKYAKNLKKGGFSDWRIPTIDELKIIYKYKDKAGLDQNDGCFCASVIKSDDRDGAHYMDFEGGLVSRDDTKSGDAYVRCVR